MKLLIPAVRYADSGRDSRVRWKGYVWEWKSRRLFGRDLTNPFQVELHVYASSLAEASALLAMKAEAQGYALGGVFGIHQAADNSLPEKKQKASVSKRATAPKKLTNEEKAVLLASLEAELSQLEVAG